MSESKAKEARREAKENEKPDFEIIIEAWADGRCKVTGPINDPLLFTEIMLKAWDKVNRHQVTAAIEEHPIVPGKRNLFGPDGKILQ